MTVHVWPVDAVTGAPSFTGRALRETMAPLLAGATPARPLGARSGVRPGTSTTTVTATSTVWTVGPHAGILDLETAAEAGPYAYAVNANLTGAVTAAHATLARVDIVYVRLDDPAESDGTAAPLVAAGYLAGTAAASPAAPATPARCMVLAWINVPLSGGGSPTVTWKAPYAVAAGATIPVASQAVRDALTSYDGLRVYRLDTHTTEGFDGTSWVGAPGSIMGTPTSTSSSGTASSGDVRDAVLGNFTFTAVAGRRYRAVLDGLVSSGSVPGDQITYKIRNGGASTPTNLSPSVAANVGIHVVSGRIPCPLSGTFVPGAGVVTLSVFSVRVSGTGSCTPQGDRELYAVDLGPA